MPRFKFIKLKTLKYRRFIERHTKSPIRKSNDISVLTNGDEIFPAMLDAIANAKDSIAFLTYVYWRGDIAVQFATALSDKARDGVTVSVLMDAFGSSKIDKTLIDNMQQAGVHFLWFRPLNWQTIHKFNNRTHRKILVVDNSIGFLGGVGIAEEWTGNAQDTHHWRDTHFRIVGPAVSDLIDSFNDNWQEAGGAPLPNTYAGEQAPGKITAQVTSSKATGRRTYGDKLFMSAIRSAQVNINITTAYFAPSAQFRHALLVARASGVRVTILTNGDNTNHQLVRKAGHSYYTQLLAGGIEIYEYQQTLLHTKVVTIDETWATVGSINFDDRSFVLNDEINLSFSNPTLVRELDEQLTTDLSQSRQVVLYKWLARPMRLKIGEFIGNLLRTQL
jgi:cardiolipin synthase